MANRIQTTHMHTCLTDTAVCLVGCIRPSSLLSTVVVVVICNTLGGRHRGLLLGRLPLAIARIAPGGNLEDNVADYRVSVRARTTTAKQPSRPRQTITTTNDNDDGR